MRYAWFLAVLLLVGCAPTLTRVGPGECVVLADREQVVAAGSGCDIQRIYR